MLSALLLLALSQGGHAAGFGAIDAPDIDAHIQYLCSPALEGRDTPSRGLDEAARYIAAQLMANPATSRKARTGRPR
jgi:hypothetical protein